MSLEDLHNGLRDLVPADIGVAAWATTHFGKPIIVIEGNRLISSVNTSDLPVMVMELGDGTPDETTLGGGMDRTTANIEFAVVWSEQDHTQAHQQRLELPDLVNKALIRNRTLGGLVNVAWLVKWVPDRGVNHPTQVMRFAAAGEYDLTV